MIAFKEWKCVCDALVDGTQTVILRKGGIHEGREGFSFAHQAFHLFPTRFHATPEQLKPGIVSALQPEWNYGDLITITHWCEAEWARTLTDWQEVMAYHADHIYSESTVRDRFDWEGKGMSRGSIHMAKVRVHAHPQPLIFPYAPRHGGCRSWVEVETI
jgi:hypothetical protein